MGIVVISLPATTHATADGLSRLPIKDDTVRVDIESNVDPMVFNISQIQMPFEKFRCCL